VRDLFCINSKLGRGYLTFIFPHFKWRFIWSFWWCIRQFILFNCI